MQKRVLVATLACVYSLLAPSFQTARADDAKATAPADDTLPLPPPAGDQDMGPKGGLPPHLMSKLGLSADQQSKVAAIHANYKAKFKDLRSQVKAEHEAVEALVVAHASQDAATAEHKKLQALMDQMGDLRFAEMYEIGGVLTAAQRTQMADLQKEMFKKFAHHHGHHGQHHDDRDGESAD